MKACDNPECEFSHHIVDSGLQWFSVHEPVDLNTATVEDVHNVRVGKELTWNYNETEHTNRFCECCYEKHEAMLDEFFDHIRKLWRLGNRMGFSKPAIVDYINENKWRF